MDKKKLYDSIMSSVAVEIKKTLNEYGGGIVNYDLYNFAIKILEPICEKYFKRAVWAKVKTKASKPKNGQDLHRASFNVMMKSMDNPKDPGEKFSVTCKIYNPDKDTDTISIDYEPVMLYQYYKFVATVIDNTAYYISVVDLMKYQQTMKNGCISKNGKFMYVSADYIIDNATYSAELDPDDINVYNSGCIRYLKNK